MPMCLRLVICFLEKPYQDLDFAKIESNAVRCPDEATAEKMEKPYQNNKKNKVTQLEEQ